MMHEPTREELLLCWMTLMKVRDCYPLDAVDDAMLLDIMKLVDRLQAGRVH